LGLILAEIGLVFFLSARADRLSPGTATALFMTYAALNGVTLSFVLLAYTGESVASTFMVTAGMFGAMALYGSTCALSAVGGIRPKAHRTAYRRDPVQRSGLAKERACSLLPGGLPCRMQ
jgi:hypothetical protein